jgi:hypothetical protein
MFSARQTESFALKAWIAGAVDASDLGAHARLVQAQIMHVAFMLWYVATGEVASVQHICTIVVASCYMMVVGITRGNHCKCQ